MIQKKRSRNSAKKPWEEWRELEKGCTWNSSCSAKVAPPTPQDPCTQEGVDHLRRPSSKPEWDRSGLHTLFNEKSQIHRIKKSRYFIIMNKYNEHPYACHPKFNMSTHDQMCLCSELSPQPHTWLFGSKSQTLYYFIHKYFNINFLFFR